MVENRSSGFLLKSIIQTVIISYQMLHKAAPQKQLKLYNQCEAFRLTRKASLTPNS